MRMIDADKLIEHNKTFVGNVIVRQSDIDKAPTVEAIPIDYIWERAEWYEKQWLEEDNHWCKNVAEALRALLEDWEGEK